MVAELIRSSTLSPLTPEGSDAGSVMLVEKCPQSGRELRRRSTVIGIPDKEIDTGATGIASGIVFRRPSALGRSVSPNPDTDTATVDPRLAG